MKKTTFLLFSMLAIIVLLSACSNESGITAFEIEASVDTRDGGLHTNECELWSVDKCNAFKSAQACDTAIVEFNGESFLGEYWYSIVEMFNNYQTDYYTFDNGWFSISANDKNLSSIVFYTVGTGAKGLDDCKEDAIHLAEQFIDVNQYKLKMSANDKMNTYVFEKYIGDCRTCATLSVGISTDGNIVTFCQMMTNELEHIITKESIDEVEKTLRILTSNEGNKAVAEKIKSIYKDINDYEIVDKIMVVLDDGDVGIVYVVNVSWANKPKETSDQEDIGSARIYILVKETMT